MHDDDGDGDVDGNGDGDGDDHDHDHDHDDDGRAAEEDDDSDDEFNRWGAWTGKRPKYLRATCKSMPQRHNRMHERPIGGYLQFLR